MRCDGRTVGCVRLLAQALRESKLRRGRTHQNQVPRNSFLGCLVVTVPESDTGGLPENGKALERTHAKELGKLTP